MQKILIFILFLFLVKSSFCQQTFLGFNHSDCVQPVNINYTYQNTFTGNGSGSQAYYKVFRNGTIIASGGGFNINNAGKICMDLQFVNDSVGFYVYRVTSGQHIVMKTSNYGNTWNQIGIGGPNYDSLFVVNENTVYLHYNNLPQFFVSIIKCSDIQPQKTLIYDASGNNNISVFDTIIGNPCQIDTLKAFYLNGSTPITYNIIFNSITPNISFSDLCVNSNFKIPYRLSGTFNSGNTFTAQLSDSSGSFSSPINIGFINSTVSDTISATIPSIIKSSDKYRIRVISSNPSIIGSDNGNNIKIDSLLPKVNILGSNSICLGSSILLTSSSLNHIWNNGTTSDSLIDSPITNTTYIITATNSCGLVTDSFSVLVDTTCQIVWPGDANSDGVANNLDVLELGLHYTQAGPARNTIDNSWVGFYSNNWVGNISNGKNINHSDCDGDGIINSNDTLAISYNYGFTHNFKVNLNPPINPNIFLTPDQNIFEKGSWGSISIKLGDSLNLVNNVNGLAFTMNFDTTFIEQDSVYLNFNNSFISDNNLTFRKSDFPKGKIYCATTHTVAKDTFGFGPIAKLHFKIKPNISKDTSFMVSIENAYKSDKNGSLELQNSDNLNVNITKYITSYYSILATNSINNYCIGDSVKIPYESTGIYNIGNSFIAQLSDTNGNFNTPIDVGSKSNIHSDTISAQLPNSLLPGKLYNLRIISTNPAIIGTPLPNILINETPRLEIFGTDTICQGDSTLLVVTGANQYSWNNGSTSDSILLKPLFTTSYSVSGTNLCGTSVKNINLFVDSTCLQPSYYSDFILYPNPTDGLINIISNIGTQKVEIYSLLGQLVFSSDFNANEVQINLPSAVPGVFLAKITLLNNSFVKQKIVIKK